MAKINMSELVEEISEQNGYQEAEIKDFIQDVFIPAILAHLRDGSEVALPRLGVLFVKKSRKQTRNGEYLQIPKLKASPLAKEILSGGRDARPL